MLMAAIGLDFSALLIAAIGLDYDGFLGALTGAGDRIRCVFYVLGVLFGMDLES